ncbi:MAG: EamA family transporter [Rhodospirillales bacterium]|nr:MAG: EamA family transporter [Rhodospirillales bacterium]
MWPYYAALGIGILAGIGGQILLKQGADAPTLVAQLLRPTTILGLFLYGAAAFAYLIAIRRIPVSIAFPSVSLSYVIVAVLAWTMFGEPLTALKIGGLVLICAGVWLINAA